MTTQLEKFVALYRKFGIELRVETYSDGYSIRFGEGDNKKLAGYYCFHTIVVFDLDGNFVSQGFYE